MSWATLKVFYDLFSSTAKYIKRNVYNVICKQQEEKKYIKHTASYKNEKRDTTVKLKRKDIKHICNILFHSQLEYT